MVLPEFLNFFIASTSAGAALVGLLFVAVSIAPEQMLTRRAPLERQAVAGGAFTALINALCCWASLPLASPVPENCSAPTAMASAAVSIPYRMCMTANRFRLQTTLAQHLGLPNR